ncbi:MAG: PTS lactose/cellobiose transporter subunit IIA [Elusimicrobiota bacterium]|jgi:PTS system cellobiose-specific IIA component|nr:PTS lactose/cellobiose transporter subunit IIA [Elusimicrobiota bacterium]
MADENVNEQLEEQLFEIISYVGGAKSCFIEAIRAAKGTDYATADLKMKEGSDMFVKGHKVHASLLQKEMDGRTSTVSLILIHAEDQLMAADSFKTLALEFINVYKELNVLKSK